MKVNGESIPAAEGLTVSKLLEQLGYQVSRIAVEVNRDIVPKAQYDAYALHDDDVVEIVCFMGGG
ncbi:sulfur carrier protein ThiS [Butyricicoccus sp.]|uniref:sulfur carrier protein ThiS n=1 Tax=Butyricicoccus sp. TaxID=2049021 RepID=UPI002A8F1585|nr:sulfur carrier protein ThiS [Butyricicoccus sp.]